MSEGLTEQEMRNALGLDATVLPERKVPEQKQLLRDTTQPKPKKRASTGLRVTLQATRVFEGEETTLVHDANTLSRFDAEQFARKAATKAGFRYLELISVVVIE